MPVFWGASPNVFVRRKGLLFVNLKLDAKGFLDSFNQEEARDAHEVDSNILDLVGETKRVEELDFGSNNCFNQELSEMRDVLVETVSVGVTSNFRWKGYLINLRLMFFLSLSVQCRQKRTS